MDLSGSMEILLEVALAMVLGGAIGLDREVADKPAGLRTHMLVAAAAALLVGLSSTMVTNFSLDGGGDIRTDPIRIVEAIVTGISFLGAGTIFRRGEDVVEGLTTAASLLLVGAVGICVALREYVLAVGVTVLVLVVLRLLPPVERMVTRRREARLRD